MILYIYIYIAYIYLFNAYLMVLELFHFVTAGLRDTNCQEVCSEYFKKLFPEFSETARS